MFEHFFFFNDTATTEIYTLSLHDALPICPANPAGTSTDRSAHRSATAGGRATAARRRDARSGTVHRSCAARDRKSTRLNSSHSQISYAVFCLKKKKNIAATRAAPLQSDRA